MVSQSTARMIGNIATLAFVVVIVLQPPLGTWYLPVTMAWGEVKQFSRYRYGLPMYLRLSSSLALPIIRRRAGLLAHSASRLIRILAWVITGFLFLNTLGNLASSSTAEKLVSGSLSSVLVVACLLVSSSKIDQ